MRKSPHDTRPERRPLRIFAFDPMLARGGDHRITVEIPYRAIERGERFFRDDRLEVVDYDAAMKTYYRAVDLNNEDIAMTQGLEPRDHDPQFHQQMVYAVASKVLENFDRALGRRLTFQRGELLRLCPHAFQGRNAYFDEELNAVLFGYFLADEDDPGANLPGQWIFTCLSHDIVVHEVAHAALSRLQPYYNEPTNPHVPALHEAFADLVALFQRLTFPEVVAPVIRETRGDLLASNNLLLNIGSQFGAAAGRGGPLRKIASSPDPTLMPRIREPHALGWILVSAVYLGFVNTYTRRTRDLLRIATGGSGRLPEGDLHPDLVSRLTAECVRTAQSVLSMCIRATDYMPPVDPTFSDFLRAMVTADFELNRTDESGLRAAMIESFRLHGIRPESVDSLAVDSLLLEPQSSDQPDPKLASVAQRLLGFGALQLDRNVSSRRRSQSRSRKTVQKLSSQREWIVQQNRSLAEDFPEQETSESIGEGLDLGSIAMDLHEWAQRNRELLRLDPDPNLKIAVRGFHSVQRCVSTGELLLEVVARFVQTRRGEESDLGGLSHRAGATLIVSADGRVRYRVAKPFHETRTAQLKAWVDAFDEEHGSPWPSAQRNPHRITEAFSARAMDRRRWQCAGNNF